MPFVRLIRHPASAAAPSIAIEAAGTLLAPSTVVFRYRVSGDLGRIRLPAERPGLRTDGLWRHTCFEAFLPQGDEGRYIELNFSPSGAWAAYAFDGYRSGMQPLDMKPPAVECRTDGATLTLQCTVELGAPDSDVAVGLSAVVEDVDGNHSYWALAHPRTRPDFHDRGAWMSKLERRRREEHV